MKKMKMKKKWMKDSLVKYLEKAKKKGSSTGSIWLQNESSCGRSSFFNYERRSANLKRLA